ncbi:PepSY domain-containing protein [Sphaerisporangium sp. B11E5]|uniref:PepSY domain-containing protein n=1 Tax=Sphaerisporangium sp. B11E5 TaxID=3153563 RepID=UPI00325EB6DC
MTKSKIIAGLATATLLLVGGGTALAATDLSPSPAASPAEDRPTADATPSATGSPAAAPKVSREQAERAALAKVPGGRVTSAELETEDGRQLWDVEVDATDGTEHEFDIDAATGAVASEEVDDDDHSGPGGDDDDDD